MRRAGTIFSIRQRVLWERKYHVSRKKMCRSSTVSNLLTTGIAQGATIHVLNNIYISIHV